MSNAHVKFFRFKFIGVFLCGVLFSCYDYYYQPIYPKIPGTYSKRDTLFVKNYFYVQISNGAFNTPHDDADSAMALFRNHVPKLGVPIRFSDTLTNKTDYFYLVEEKRCCGKKIEQFILDAVETADTNLTTLVPLFEITNVTEDLDYQSNVRVVVFLVKNKKIIYIGHRGLWSKSYFFNDYRDIRHNINTLEEWKTAIYGALKHYVENLH